jgi:hypothetical protein
MKIYIKSNFIVPGVGSDESLDLNCTKITLRGFLDELSTRAPTRIEYVRPGAKTLDPAEWQVEINGISYQSISDGLETVLKDEDTVTIRIMVLGGG